MGVSRLEVGSAAFGDGMSTVPRLQFKQLQGDEILLANEIAGSLITSIDERREAFGLGMVGQYVDCDIFGLCIKNEVSGAIWQRREGENIRILALALPRAWWNMGLAGWMVDHLINAGREEHVSVITATLDNGGPHLGQVFEELGFIRSADVDTEYPLGTWSKTLGPAQG